MALAELIVSASIFLFDQPWPVKWALPLWKRNYAATSDFSLNHADEMRISHYTAMDARRSIAGQAAAKRHDDFHPRCHYDQTASLHRRRHWMVRAEYFMERAAAQPGSTII